MLGLDLFPGPSLATRACRSVIIGVALCVAFFVFLLLPIQIDNVYRSRNWPIVDGRFSDHHAAYFSYKHGGHWGVAARLEFDRPGSEGPVHCHIDKYYMGPMEDTGSYRFTEQFAVNPETCGDDPRPPLSFYDELAKVFVLFPVLCVGSIFVVFMVSILGAFDKKPSTDDALKRAGYKT